jgi:hypothetical protein
MADDNALVVTVCQFRTAATALGTFALVVDTAEAGTVAFAVTREALQALRLCLDQIEHSLDQGARS